MCLVSNDKYYTYNKYKTSSLKKYAQLRFMEVLLYHKIVILKTVKKWKNS